MESTLCLVYGNMKFHEINMKNMPMEETLSFVYEFVYGNLDHEIL